MRPSRKFRPCALDALEGRVALSHAGGLAALSTGTTYERFTTTYYDGTTQVDTRLTVPNGGHTTTTTESIDLRGGAGTETVVDVATTVGNTTTHTTTITLPGGQTQTETSTEVVRGDTTVVNKTVHLADGGTRTVYGRTVRSGPYARTSETVNQTGMSSRHVATLDLRYGRLNQKELTKTTWPDHSVEIHKSNTTGVRLPPPSG
jgi:hypothetical protein